MDIKTALTYIYKTCSEKELTNPFFLFSKLSDLCNDSYENKEDAKTYWLIISKINIYKCLFKNVFFLEKDYFKDKFYKVAKTIAFSEYEKMINITIETTIENPIKTEKIVNKLNGFKIINNTLYTYTGKRKIIFIPKCVKTIKKNAFNNNSNIKLVVIPNDVEVIETFAFNNLVCLEEVRLGKVKKIQKYAFWKCNCTINTSNNFKPYLWHKNWNVYDKVFFLKKRTKTFYN